MKKKLAIFIVTSLLAGLSACGEGEPVVENDCTHLDKKCEQNSVYLCKDGVWELEKQCDAETICNTNSFTCTAPAVCADNQKRCAGKDIQQCMDGKWLIFLGCRDNEICNTTSFTCELNACSPNGSKRCNLNNVEICSGGGWKVETLCENNDICNAESLQCEGPTTCTNDSKRCNLNNVEICIDGSWEVVVQCENGDICNAESLQCEGSIHVCDQGETRCTNNGKLESCFANSWNISDCPTGQSCRSGKTACEITVCSEGEIECNDDQNGLLTCTDNAWVKTACAAPTAICYENQCVACTNGDKRCQDNAVVLCANNAWKTEKECADQVCDPVSHTCINLACQKGWQRCNANVVEVCNDAGKFEPVSPAACAAGSVCLENTVTHTTKCVECKLDAQCESVVGKPVCHSNNTCVACRAGSDNKCHATNGSLLVCNANGAWPTTGTACKSGQTCEAGQNECTPIPGYCISKSDCKDPLNPDCLNNACVCENGKTTCKTEAGQAKHAVCTNHAWSEYSTCNVPTPVCNATQTQCAECSDDIHCAEDYKCNTATNTCKSSLVESTITSCNSIYLDTTGQTAYGRVLDSRNPKDPRTITAKLLCGKNGQAINQYQEFVGKHMPDCASCGDDFEYRVRPLLRSGESYLCLWSFRLAGEKTVACQTDGTIVKDFASIPTASTAHQFKPEWDHIIDFENFKAVANYTNVETVVDGMISATKLGYIAKEGNGSIDRHTLVFSDKNDHHITVTNDEAGAYIGYLSFEYKGWTVDNFKDGQVLEIFLDDAETPFHTLPLSGKYESVMREMFSVEKAAKSFRIQRKLRSTAITPAPRVLIDNIAWTTH